MVLSRTSSLDRLLLQVVDAALAAVVLLVPFLMGGRHAVGQLVLTVLAVVAAWAWSARQCLLEDPRWRATWATPLILAALALLVLQVAPLPPNWLAWLSPHAAELLPLWGATAKTTAPAVAMGSWPCLSLIPNDTLAGLVLLLDSALLFVVAVQRIRYIEDVEQLLRWCALSAICMASFGIVQYLSSNGKFFWVYEHPFSTTSDVTKGSFTNRNHFAQFLALGIGPIIWWLQDSSRRLKERVRKNKKDAYSHAIADSDTDRNHDELKLYLLGLALGIVLFAGLLSLSRGGAIAIFCATTVCTCLCYWASAINGRFVAALGIVGLLIGVSLAIFGYDRVSNRLEDLASGSIEQMDREASRRGIWAAAVKAMPDFLLFGAGEGAFRETYPIYGDSLPDNDIEFTYAENSYLHRAVETGAVGIGLALAGIVLVAFWCVRGSGPSNPARTRVCIAAIAGSLTAIVVHGLTDFVWYVPACVAVAALLAACAIRVQQATFAEKRTERTPRHGERRTQTPSFAHLTTSTPRPTWIAATVAITLLGGWMICNRIGPAVAQSYWEEYQRGRNFVNKHSPEGLSGQKADVKTQEKWVACLENAVRWEPTHLRAHLALVETHRRLFDKLQIDSPNPMSLNNIRDAAVQSQFQSREALVEWLSRAVGPHWVHLEAALRHTRKAIGLCPLEGRAYVHLADLAFLSGGNAAAKQSCIDQALRVRPYDGAVLHAAGNEAMLAGDVPKWIEYLKRAFLASPREQRQVLGDLVSCTPKENLPGLIDFVLRELKPDLAGLQYLHGLCAPLCSPDELAPLARCRAAQAEAAATAATGRLSAALWSDAHLMHVQLGEHVEALQCARNALAAAPDSFNVHLQLANHLMSQQSFTEAETHLRWCLARAPSNKNVETRLRDAMKGRIEEQRRAAVEKQGAVAR